MAVEAVKIINQEKVFAYGLKTTEKKQGRKNDDESGQQLKKFRYA